MVFVIQDFFNALNGDLQTAYAAVITGYESTKNRFVVFGASLN